MRNILDELRAVRELRVLWIMTFILSKTHETGDVATTFVRVRTFDRTVGRFRHAVNCARIACQAPRFGLRYVVFEDNNAHKNSAAGASHRIFTTSALVARNNFRAPKASGAGANDVLFLGAPRTDSCRLPIGTT